MARGCLSFMSSVFVFLLCFGLGIAFGVQSGSIEPFILLSILGIFLAFFAAKLAFTVGRINMESWLSEHSSCKYKYAWDGTGIALDQSTKKMHLSSIFSGEIKQRTYNLADIRSFGYNIEGYTVQQPSTVVGGGLQGAGHNIGASMAASLNNAMSAGNATEKTGLWIKVADVDFPKWFIKFTGKNREEIEMNMERWMEILDQFVNESY